MEDDLRLILRKYALVNALQHNGKAEVKPVVSKVLAERRDLKGRAKELVTLAELVVEEVNKMTLEKQKQEADSLGIQVLKTEKEEKQKTLPELPNVKGTVVTRFAPNPDGPLHLGNARAAVLSHEYSRIYKGVFILRFDDTDPKVKRPIRDAYVGKGWIQEDLKWLGLSWDREFTASSRMERYYEIARLMIKNSHAYVDITKDQKGVKPSEEPESEELPKRRRPEWADSPETNLELFDRMLQRQYGEGEAVVRIKTDLDDPDPSQVDWVMLRIVDTTKSPHPITYDKYTVYPTYNFATVVDDHDSGITHILRGKEHQTNTLKQARVYEKMGWTIPEVIQFGRLKLEGFMMSKSKIRGIMETGAERDDPRLPTLAGLRRRGILAETLREIIIEVGVKTSDATISFDNIAAANRKRLDQVAKRLMFVKESTALYLRVETERPLEARIPFHPSKPDYNRRITINPDDIIVIDRDDITGSSGREGAEIRLMELGNFLIVTGDGENMEKSNPGKGHTLHGVAKFKNNDLNYARANKLKIIQWIDLKNYVPVVVNKVENGEIVEEKGLGEHEISKLQVNDIVQFIRYGFVRKDSTDPAGRQIFIYAHE